MMARPNGLKNSAGGEDPDRSSPIAGESMERRSAGERLGGILWIWEEADFLRISGMADLVALHS